LTGAARVYFDQSAPSIFSFVRNLGDKSSPSSIVNRLAKQAASQAFNVQVFDNNRSEVLNQPEGETMLKFVPPVSDSSVNLWKQCNGLATAMRALLAAGNLPLRAAKSGFGLPIPARVWNWRAIRESRKIFQTQVHSDCVIERWQGLGFAFNREAYVPLTEFALSGDRFNRARHRTVPLDFDRSDALNTKHLAVQFDAVAVTGKRDAIEATAGLESRIARFFAALHATKERRKGFVHAAQNVLAATKVRQTQVTRSANFLQLIGLRVVVDRHALLPSVATFLQSRVIESAGFSQLSVESVRLEARCE